jgi:hypothetical protein
VNKLNHWVLWDRWKGEDRDEEETSSTADEQENAGRSAMCHGEGMYDAFRGEPADDQACRGSPSPIIQHQTTLSNTVDVIAMAIGQKPRTTRPSHALRYACRGWFRAKSWEMTVVNREAANGFWGLEARIGISTKSTELM